MTDMGPDDPFYRKAHAMLILFEDGEDGRQDRDIPTWLLEEFGTFAPNMEEDSVYETESTDSDKTVPMSPVSAVEEIPVPANQVVGNYPNVVAFDKGHGDVQI